MMLGGGMDIRGVGRTDRLWRSPPFSSRNLLIPDTARSGRAVLLPSAILAAFLVPQIGAQGGGAANMLADGKPEHQLPYTAFGLAMLAKKNKSG